MNPITRVVFDCKDPIKLADFWAAATGYKKAGWASPETNEMELIYHPDKVGPGYLFHANPDEKKVKNRVHVEFDTKDMDADVGRLVELGARVVATHTNDGVNWTVMADPEGNEFCMVKFG
jgi:predicted enzyme related to lactoylglutathione lyase